MSNNLDRMELVVEYLEKQALETLVDHGLSNFSEYLHDGTMRDGFFAELYKHYNRKDIPLQARWSLRVLKRAIVVRCTMPNDPEPEELAFVYAGLIRASEKTKFSGFVPEIERSRKIKNAAKKGHEAIHGTQKEKVARWAEYQSFINKTHQAFPRLSYSKCAEMAAEHFNVSSKTIKRHTTNWK